MYAVRILLSHPVRLVLTVGGISLCIVLMLFLLGIYRGVADGSVDYIRYCKADLWVLQKNSTNILRGTSILSSMIEEIIYNNDSVEEVSPVILILSTIKKDDEFCTIFIAGYDHTSSYGGPPFIKEGRNVANHKEIVLDESFVHKMKYKLGDNVIVQDETLKLVGLSSGTNAFVIQYGFTTIECAKKLLGYSQLVTCYLIKLKSGSNKKRVVAEIENKIPGTVVYDQKTFLKNNIKEAESGILPIFYAIAAIGAIVLTVILSLILSINILEKRKDFAVMKAIGAPSNFIPRLVFEQAFMISLLSNLTSIALFFPMTIFIEMLSPEVSTKTTLLQIIIVIVVAFMISILSSFISIKRIKKIYPLEVFA